MNEWVKAACMLSSAQEKIQELEKILANLKQRTKIIKRKDKTGTGFKNVEKTEL